jgi:hypothetical protein
VRTSSLGFPHASGSAALALMLEPLADALRVATPLNACLPLAGLVVLESFGFQGPAMARLAPRLPRRRSGDGWTS